MANDGLYGERNGEMIQKANTISRLLSEFLTNNLFQMLVAKIPPCRNLMDEQTTKQEWDLHQQTLKSQHCGIMCHSEKIAS